MLPPWLDWLKVEDLEVGEGSSISFLARRSQYTATVEILNRRGPVSVEVRNYCEGPQTPLSRPPVS
jgi:hypothetical protein